MTTCSSYSRFSNISEVGKIQDASANENRAGLFNHVLQVVRGTEESNPSN